MTNRSEKYWKIKISNISKKNPKAIRLKGKMKSPKNKLARNQRSLTRNNTAVVVLPSCGSR